MIYIMTMIKVGNDDGDNNDNSYDNNDNYSLNT